ncbi:hypothetical protein EON71_01195 [bacterium]|nr:MAG: hypothetical protein EON71_01195 [bacterium]
MKKQVSTSTFQLSTADISFLHGVPKEIKVLATWRVNKCNGECADYRECHNYHVLPHGTESYRRNPYYTNLSLEQQELQPYPYTYSMNECTPLERAYHPLAYKKFKCDDYERYGKCSLGKYCAMIHGKNDPAKSNADLPTLFTFSYIIFFASQKNNICKSK